MKFTLAVLLLAMSSAAQNTPATLVLRNANIYTVDDRRPRAEAVAVTADRITFVGSNAEVQKYVGPNTRLVDLKGATVLPGLTDAHYHFMGVGARELTFNLEGTRSLDDLLAKLKAEVAKHKPGEWIVGRGWIETFWKPPVFPSRWDLDKVSPLNPVVLGRADGHGAVVNSAALDAADVEAKTKDPFGGKILRAQEGVGAIPAGVAADEPNGMLLDNAQGLVRRRVKVTPNDPAKEAIAANDRSIALGWCQVQDAGGSWADVELFRRLYDEGRMKIRIYKAVHGPGAAAERLLREGASVGEFGHRFTLRTIKVVADGALGSRGAAMLAPYSDEPNTSGFLTVKAEELRPMLVEALKRGIQVETHAIGDKANRFVLDEYERAFSAVPPEQRKVREPRWRDEHTQIVALADLPRFGKLGVIPSMQPSHAIGDLFFAPRRIGAERLAGAYAWQSFRTMGVIVAGGSDAPVERGEPMIEYYAAVARKPLPQIPAPASWEGWHPEEKLSREDALKAFTLWPAMAAFEEELKGTIAPGKLADFTVLSADILKIPEPEIPKTRNLMTVINGEIVYEAKP